MNGFGGIKCTGIDNRVTSCNRKRKTKQNVEQAKQMTESLIDCRPLSLKRGLWGSSRVQCIAVA